MKLIGKLDMSDPLRDSLTRCDSSSYSSMYDVRSRSDVKKQVASPDSVQKDTLEVYKDRAQKEALGRLHRTTQYLVVQNGFIRIGKYLFTGVVLPPYLFLYAIPKWVVLVAMPSLISMTIQGVSKGFDGVKKRLETALHQGNQILQGMLKSLNVLVQPIKRLALDIKNAMLKLMQPVIGLFAQAGSFGRKILRLGKKESKAASFIARSKRVLIEMQKGTARVLAALSTGFIKGMASFSRPFRKVLQGRFLNVFVGVRSLGDPFFTSLQNSRLSAHRVTEWVAKSLRLPKEFLKGYLDHAGQTCRQTILPLLKSCSSKFKRFLSGALDFFDKKRKKLTFSVEARLSNLNKRAGQAFFQFSLRWFPGFLRRRLINFLHGRKGQKILHILAQAFSRTVGSFWRGLVCFFRLIRLAFVGGWKFMMGGRKSLKICFQMVCKALSGLFSIGGQSSKTGFYHLLVFLILIGLLLKWMFQSLGSRTAKLFSAMKKFS